MIIKVHQQIYDTSKNRISAGRKNWRTLRSAVKDFSGFYGFMIRMNRSNANHDALWIIQTRSRFLPSAITHCAIDPRNYFMDKGECVSDVDSDLLFIKMLIK